MASYFSYLVPIINSRVPLVDVARILCNRLAAVTEGTESGLDLECHQVSLISLKYSDLARDCHSRVGLCPRMKRITFFPHSQLDWESREHSNWVPACAGTTRISQNLEYFKGLEDT